MNLSRPTAFARRAPVATIGLTLALALSACTSAAAAPASTPTPASTLDPTVVLQNSATALATLKSVHVDVTLSGTVSDPSAAAPSPITLDGIKLSADIDIANAKGTASLTTPAALGGLSADLIVSGDIYVKAPAILKSDKWSKIPSALLTSMMPGSLASPLPSPAAAAADLGSMLSASGITVTSGGTDSCADGTCNKTVITIPAAALQKAAGAASSAAPMAGAVPGLSSLGSLGDATVTVWTAQSNGGRLNKMTLAASAGSAGSFALAVTLSNFDAPVTVTVPSADQITDFAFPTN